MDENLTSVNAEQVSDESSQTETQVEQVNSESENSGVATLQNEKTAQSAEENAKYAQVRREAEQKAYTKAQAETQKAIDSEYSRLYGTEYGIHSKADYDKAVAEQQATEERERIQEETGIDPDNLKPIFEQWKKSDPDFQELSRTRADNNVKLALADLNSELKDAGIDLQLNDLSDTEITKLPNIGKITEYVKQGQSLANAFFLANKKDIIAKQTAKAEQETIKKITANGASSPGSLASGVQAETFFTKEQVEKMTKDDVMKNYATIIKSTPKW